MWNLANLGQKCEFKTREKSARGGEPGGRDLIGWISLVIFFRASTSGLQVLISKRRKKIQLQRQHEKENDEEIGLKLVSRSMPNVTKFSTDPAKAEWEEDDEKLSAAKANHGSQHQNLEKCDKKRSDLDKIITWLFFTEFTNLL